jgi:hypothetical protein
MTTDLRYAGTVRFRGMETGISEASKRVSIFSFATLGGKQVSFYFQQGNSDKDTIKISDKDTIKVRTRSKCKEDERSGGDVLLDAGRLRHVLEATIALEESEMMVWLTVRPKKWAMR